MPAQAAESQRQLDHFICFAVYSTNLAFNRVYRPLLESLGLTYVQYIVMVALWDRDDQFVGRLGERLFLASNTLTPVVKRLETLGYVCRTRDTTDERQVRVHLTEAGRSLRAAAAGVPDCIVAASGLRLPEIDRMLDGLLRLREQLLNGPPQDGPQPSGLPPAGPRRSSRRP